MIAQHYIVNSCDVGSSNATIAIDIHTIIMSKVSSN